MLERFTDDEKLSVIERILDDLRTQSGWFPMPGDREVLKAVCMDYRNRQPETANKAIEVIEFQINSAMRSQAQLGYLDVGHAQAVAERALKYWPTIRRALEQSAKQAV